MKIGIVADDLTGANATGVLLNKQGFTSATVVQTTDIETSSEMNALCIDTDSRYAPDDVVIDKVSKATKHFLKWGAQIISKRIDSTIRGKIGLEIDTVLNELGDNSVAIVVGAFPDSGRVCSGGYLLVDGVPVQETDVAKDPQKGIHSSYIPGVIANQSHHFVGYIGLDQVLAKDGALFNAISAQIKQGNRIIVIDAVRDEDIDAIAHAMAQVKDTTLIPVDPGPLTAAYATAYFDQFVERKKVIVTVGSVTSLSKKQLAYVQRKTNTVPIVISAERLARLDTWEDEVKARSQEAINRIDDNDVLVITTVSESGKLIDLAKLAKEQSTTGSLLAKKITDGLAQVTCNVMKITKHDIQGCFTSGGDVTASLCSATNSSGILLEDEVFPLAAFGRLMGGDFPEQPIITKGGLIGDEKAIYKCIKYFNTQHSRKTI